MTSFYRNILQLILSPTKGWEDVDASKPQPQRLAMECMYPLFGVAALSVFVQMAFKTDIQFSTMFIRAFAVFVSYFVTYFFACALSKQYLSYISDEDDASEKCNTVIVYALSLLALASVVCNLLPLTVGLTYIMPLAVAIVMWKANAYLKVAKDGDSKFILFVILAVVIPPTLIQSMFDYLLVN